MRDETMESDYLLVGQRRHYGMVGDRNKQQRKTHSNRQKTKKNALLQLDVTVHQLIL